MKRNTHGAASPPAVLVLLREGKALTSQSMENGLALATILPKLFRSFNLDSRETAHGYEDRPSGRKNRQCSERLSSSLLRVLQTSILSTSNLHSLHIDHLFDAYDDDDDDTKGALRTAGRSHNLHSPGPAGTTFIAPVAEKVTTMTTERERAREQRRSRTRSLNYTLPSIPTSPLSPLSWQPWERPGSPDTDFSRQSFSSSQGSRRPSLEVIAARRASSPPMVGPKSPDVPPTMPTIAEIIDPPPEGDTERPEFPAIQPVIAESIRRSSRSRSRRSAGARSSTGRATTPIAAAQEASRSGSSSTMLSLKEIAQMWTSQSKLKTRVAILAVWTVVFVLVLTIYLTLFTNNRLQSAPAQIALILICLVAGFFFFHSLVRVSLVLARPYSYPDEERPETSHSTAPIFAGMTLGPGPWGYAQPQRPIQVYAVPGQSEVALDDDDAAAPKEIAPPPPAYGFWRQTVRVNPAQFYWVRRSQSNDRGVYSHETEQVESAATRNSVASTVTRPPSYISRRVSALRAASLDEAVSPRTIPGQRQSVEILPPADNDSGLL
ncbi:hypothetical protein Dda_0525 [Drechslerella dactyloides]|uniref:Uncharacterized protein n=1 Tax=Drechslerella dactyloides TaxID=74499 RepID=A0AAD6J6H7_DREDA|nr:hypothetical protein Dda_0525 [Drechslerella dactyloides]